MDKYYYGIINKQQIFDTIDRVVDVLGGGLPAKQLLAGTIATETNFGRYLDPTPDSAGMGISQFDRLPFYSIKKRICDYRIDLCDKIKEEFDIDIRKVDWSNLKHNPLYAIIFCRLFYKLIPDAIPEDLEDQAKYWKKFYNTELGKGTTDKFVEKYNKYVGDYY